MEERYTQKADSPVDKPERVQKESGELKIFFGYAAGVGKTYAMLEAAHQAKEEGVDVVVGYVERHTRPDTLALLEGLEILPCKEINYRGIRLKEFDLDRALERKPALILVDELAHSNARGSRHMKRYQDIEELLRAGIDVYTSMNVQHLESLNDLVSSITGVVVNERVPDYVFDLADQVELVDIEPSDLVKRLRAGKIYKAKQVKQALEHFFRGENLTALREIAMRRTADHLNRAALQDGQAQSARAGEHILTCISSSPSNAKVIRTAARMAEAFHSGFTALFVQTPETKNMSGEDQKRLAANQRLAEQLGAQIATVYGADPAEQIAEYARVSGVTKIVIGRINHKVRTYAGKKSLADRLLEQTDLDVYIIPDQQPLYKKPRVKMRNRKDIFSWKDVGKTLLVLVCATLISFGFYSAGFSESNIITVYILGVLTTAVWTNGHLYGALNSLLSVAAFNFFFTVPRYTFEAYDSSYPMTFIIMLLSSFLASSLASRVKIQARLAAAKGYYMELLFENSQKLQRGRSEWECLSMTADQLSQLLDRPVIYMKDEIQESSSFHVAPSEEADIASLITQEDLGVARWVQKNNKHAGATTDTLPDSKWLFMAVRGTQSVMAVMGIPIAGYPLPDAFEKNLVVAILGECGLSMERLRLQEERNAAALQAQKEHLQAHLLRAVSHDLRTPLTNISGSAGMLMQCDSRLDEEERQKLYEGIYDDSGWLVNLTENLLAATKIENGRYTHMKPELIEDIFQAAVEKLDRRAREHQITVTLEDPELIANMNASFILRVIVNIMNNAIQYTPAGSHIELKGVNRKEHVEISITDDGPGISQEEKNHLFDLFYTAGQGKADSQRGLGLGLHLCRSIVERHNGMIWVEDNEPQGTVFRFTLPLAANLRKKQK